LDGSVGDGNLMRKRHGGDERRRRKIRWERWLTS
jgi:hypothetical protein